VAGGRGYERDLRRRGSERKDYVARVLWPYRQRTTCDTIRATDSGEIECSLIRL